MKTYKLLCYLRGVLEYHPETGTFHWKCSRNGQCVVGGSAGFMHSSGYWIIEVLGKQFRRNILAWAFTFSYWPTKRIDHKDRVKHNDKISNLREATASENGANGDVYISNQLGQRGITNLKGRLRVCLYKNGKQHYAGCFGTMQEAIAARDALAKRLHGDFAP